MRTLAFLLLMSAPLCAADISGIVVADHDRAPIAAAAVTLRQNATVIAELETNEEGRFHLANVPAGEFTIQVRKSSFIPLECRIEARATAVNVFLRVVKHAAITGTVVDFEGRPVRNTVVAAVPVSAERNQILFFRRLAGGAAPVSVATDSRGVYRIHGLAPGAYAIALMLGQTRDAAPAVAGLVPDTSTGNYVHVYPENSRPQTFTFHGGEEVSGINFSIYRGPLFSIKGTVSGAPGSYRVILQNADLRSFALGATNAAPGKGFEFTRVPPGAYRIVVVSQRTFMLELPADFALPANLPPDLVIVEVRPGVRAIVDFIPVDEPPRPGGDPVNGSPPVMFGELMVVVGNENAEGGAVPIFPGVSSKVVYQPAEGCPASASIQLSPTEDWGAGAVSQMMEEGKEVNLTLPPTPFTLTLGGTGAACFLQMMEIDFRQSPPSDAIPLVALPYGSIKGIIRTVAFPADDYELALISESGATKWLLPDAKASFAFNQLQPGRYRIAVFQAAGDRSIPLVAKEIEVIGGKATEIGVLQLP